MGAHAACPGTQLPLSQLEHKCDVSSAIGAPQPGQLAVATALSLRGFLGSSAVGKGAGASSESCGWDVSCSFLPAMGLAGANSVSSDLFLGACWSSRLASVSSSALRDDIRGLNQGWRRGSWSRASRGLQNHQEREQREHEGPDFLSLAIHAETPRRIENVPCNRICCIEAMRKGQLFLS